MSFARPEDSHAHSLQTLNLLYEYDDFMISVGTMIDLGCGSGLDVEWWATRTTRDDPPEPLRIRCMAVDHGSRPSTADRTPGITFQQIDFETSIQTFKKTGFDMLWCHDSFQYAIDPLGTLAKWRNIANDNAMLAIIVPQSTNLQHKALDFSQTNGCYYHHTLVSLIHMLAVNGWDCRDGFFLKKPDDPWLHAIVYKSKHKPLDVRTTTWYDLAERDLLPESAVAGINRHGFLRQEDLVLPWLDKNLRSYSKH